MVLRKRYAKGFTLIELIIVISIIGILTAISVPVYGRYVKEAKETVCNANCAQVERDYEIYLEMESVEHTDAVFEQFLNEYGKDICPEHGVITYVDGEVQCSVYVSGDESDDEGDGDGDVPYL